MHNQIRVINLSLVCILHVNVDNSFCCFICCFHCTFDEGHIEQLSNFFISCHSFVHMIDWEGLRDA